mmetsp:Transcript_20801/g.26923  ORF Transcript_20801/g.26923 Transcript_20801/m.26923 type:complete len:394 (+) Transcript_20801:3-1184(+)
MQKMAHKCLSLVSCLQVVFGLQFHSSRFLGTNIRLGATVEKATTFEYDPTLGENAPLTKNNNGGVWFPQLSRPRRNRKSEAMRKMVAETTLSAANLMQPIFIHDKDEIVDIGSMPGQSRHGMNSMLDIVEKGLAVGVQSFILFPKVEDDLKSNYGQESYNMDGLVQRSVRAIKEKFPQAIIVTDIALDPYSDQGHDGIVIDGKIVNDMTIQQLCKQAVSHARAGADIVAPSDMMDGRIAAIRMALDAEGFTDVSIIAYTAKYASAFYGPFRDALDSHPGFGDKKTYQQDPANGREALIEAALDASEGADMLLVKPGMPYLDIIHRLRTAADLPIAAYHVSGEYAMLKAAALNGWIDEKAVVLETLLCFRRAGADVILTYFATQAATWLKEDNN